VNIFKDRCFIDSSPRLKKGAPAHTTTGVAKMSCVADRMDGCRNAKIGFPSPMSDMLIKAIGSVKVRLIQNRFCISFSSMLLELSAVGCSASSAMPHFGQFPGLSLKISGCIGHVNFASALSEIILSSCIF